MGSRSIILYFTRVIFYMCGYYYQYTESAGHCAGLDWRWRWSSKWYAVHTLITRQQNNCGILRTRRHNSVGECQMLVINMGTEAKNKKTEA